MTHAAMSDNNQNSPDLSTTLLVGVLGGVLLSQRRQRPAGSLAILAGLGMIAYAARPLARRWVLRHGESRRRLRLKTTLEIKRPVTEVFAFCKDFANFPEIIGSLRRVIDYEDGRSHWEGYSLTGEIVEWDAVVTKYVPNAVIAWASVPASDVRTSGVIRFAAAASGGTRVTVELTYLPRPSGVSDALHALAAQPREQQIRADLAGASFYLESLPSATFTRGSAA